MTQGANLISNVPHNLTEAGKTIAMTIRHALDNGYAQVRSDQGRRRRVARVVVGRGRAACSRRATTPARRAITNNEGQPGGAGSDLFVGYPAGAMAYFQYIDRWRSKG